MDGDKKSQGVVITMQDHYFATGIKVLLSCGQLGSISGGLTMTLCSFTPNCLIFSEERHGFPKRVQSPPELVWRGSRKEHERNLTSDFKAVIWETIIIKEKKSHQMQIKVSKVTGYLGRSVSQTISLSWLLLLPRDKLTAALKMKSKLSQVWVWEICKPWAELRHQKGIRMSVHLPRHPSDISH